MAKIPDCNDGQGTRPWSDLPHLILSAIAMQLINPFTFFAFGRVCQSWRSVFKASFKDFMASQPPLLFFTHPQSNSFYSLTEKRHYPTTVPQSAVKIKNCVQVGQFHGYAILLKRKPKQPKTFLPFLLNPLTWERINFPEIESLSDPVTSLLSAPPSCSDCKLFLVFDRSILFCPMGGISWIECNLKGDDQFPDCNCVIECRSKDAVLFEGRVYILTTCGRFVAVEVVEGPRFNVFRVDLDPPNAFRCVGLVPADGELLEVCFSSEYRKFEVFLLDISRRERVRLESMGDRALFIKWYDFPDGEIHCITRAKGVRSNCIYYFTNATFKDYHLAKLFSKAGPWDDAVNVHQGNSWIPTRWVPPSIYKPAES